MKKIWKIFGHQKRDASSESPEQDITAIAGILTAVCPDLLNAAWWMLPYENHIIFKKSYYFCLFIELLFFSLVRHLFEHTELPWGSASWAQLVLGQRCWLSLVLHMAQSASNRGDAKLHDDVSLTNTLPSNCHVRKPSFWLILSGLESLRKEDLTEYVVVKLRWRTRHFSV